MLQLLQSELLRNVRGRIFFITFVLCWIFSAYFSLFLLGSFNQVVMRAERSSAFVETSIPRFEDYVLSSYFHSMSFILVLLVSFLFMSVLAGDRERGILQYFRQSGVGAYRLVAAKSLALLVLLSTLIAVALALAAALRLIVPFSWLILLSAAIGLFVGLLYCSAVAFTVSSVSKRSANAGLITFLLLLFLYSLATLKDFFPGDWFVVIEFISPGVFWQEAFSGYIAVNRILSFLLLSFVMFLFSAVMLRRRGELW